MEEMISGFTKDDVEEVVRILKKWDGGKIPTELFTVLAGMLPIPVLETVILRQHKNMTQVLLIPRPKDDIVWPGMIHSPGGALRRADYFREDKNPNNGVFERIEKQEIGMRFITAPELVGVIVPGRISARGPEMCQIFLGKIDENTKLPEGAGWYDVEELNKIPNFIQHQIPAINMALGFFKEKYL